MTRETESSARTLSPLEAERAIYIDFECVGTKPPTPAVLGVLHAADQAPFEQVIVHPELAPARLAQGRLRVADVGDAVRVLVDLARRDGRLIVGWSFFDRDVAIAAAPGSAGDLRALYRNALHTARPWRAAVHPGFTVRRADRFAPKHTLDQYAHLAGYPGVSQLTEAFPADWIRHTLTQLRAQKGFYRRTTKQTKRDWHDLLEYNRQDCLALRHIILKAGRELAAWRAYERTKFCVEEDSRRFCFKAGAKNESLDALLDRHGEERWAFITAWNPGSVELRRAENDSRQRALVSVVEAAGLAWIPGQGVGEDPLWTPEGSLLVLGVSRAAAVKTGRRFGQLAVVVGRRGGPALLVPCASQADRDSH